MKYAQGITGAVQMRICTAFVLRKKKKTGSRPVFLMVVQVTGVEPA